MERYTHTHAGMVQSLAGDDVKLEANGIYQTISSRFFLRISRGLRVMAPFPSASDNIAEYRMLYPYFMMSRELTDVEGKVDRISLAVPVLQHLDSAPSL